MKRINLIVLFSTMLLSAGCLKLDELSETPTIYESEFVGTDYITLYSNSTVVQPGMPTHRRNYVQFRLDKSVFPNGLSSDAKLRIVTRVIDDDYYSHGNYNYYLISIPAGNEYIHSRQYGLLKPGANLYFEFSVVEGDIELKRHYFSYTI